LLSVSWQRRLAQSSQACPEGRRWPEERARDSSRPLRSASRPEKSPTPTLAGLSSHPRASPARAHPGCPLTSCWWCRAHSRHPGRRPTDRVRQGPTRQPGRPTCGNLALPVPGLGALAGPGSCGSSICRRPLSLVLAVHAYMHVHTPHPVHSLACLVAWSPVLAVIYRRRPRWLPFWPSIPYSRICIYRGAACVARILGVFAILSLGSAAPVDLSGRSSALSPDHLTLAVYPRLGERAGRIVGLQCLPPLCSIRPSAPCREGLRDTLLVSATRLVLVASSAIPFPKGSLRPLPAQQDRHVRRGPARPALLDLVTFPSVAAGGSNARALTPQNAPNPQPQHRTRRQGRIDVAAPVPGIQTRPQQRSDTRPALPSNHIAASKSPSVQLSPKPHKTSEPPLKSGRREERTQTRAIV